MILPKELFDKIEYFEHTLKHNEGTQVYDVFTIHFKSWFRKKRVIKIKRYIDNFDNDDGTFTHSPTSSAGDLYNQLNDWATDTFEEKLSSIKHKYETNNEDNVIQLKPKPKDMDNE